MKPLTIKIDNKNKIIRKVIKFTPSEFEGYYKQRHIHCWLDENNKYYIQVTAPCGMYDYDGYSKSETLRDSIRDALIGAML